MRETSRAIGIAGVTIGTRYMSLITIDQLDMAAPMARYANLVGYIDFR